jgi:hypothetical protein
MESSQLIEEASTWDCIIVAAHQGTAQGLKHRAQGKNNKRSLILSLCLAPYALCLKLIQQLLFLLAIVSCGIDITSWD